jgi:hypothetical protein
MGDYDYHDLTSLTDTLKTVYGQGLTNQFEDEKTTYTQFPKSERKPKGLGYEFGLRYARAQSVGGRGESQALPPPLVGKFDKGLIQPRYVYGVIRMTGPAISAAKGDRAAFVDGLADSVEDIYNSLVVDLNRQCHGDGFGLLATLSAVSDALTTSGSTWTITCNNDVGVKYLKEGMIVDFYQSTAIDESSVASRISSVDPFTKTAEMEPNDGTYKAIHPIVAARSYSITTDTVASGSYVVRMGAREATHATTNTPYEMTGMNGLFDDGTLLASFENITVANYPKWKANILGNNSVNRELSIDLMLQACDLTRVQAGKAPTVIRLGLGQRRKYAALLSPDVRFAPGELKGGYEILSFSAGDGSIKMVVDPDTQPNKMYFHPEGVIQRYEMEALGWGNLDQQMHWVPGYDQWDQFLRIYTNLGVEQRNCLTLIKDLVEPPLYS